MVTIQSADVNSYVRSLLDKVMDNNVEGNESVNTTGHPDRNHRAESDAVAATETNTDQTTTD